MRKILLIIFCGGLLNAAVQDAYKLSVAQNGALVLAEPFNNQIRILRSDKTETIVQQDFDQPQAAVLDAKNNLYVLDTGKNRLRQFSFKSGVWQETARLDGFRYPRALAFSPEQEFLYVLDSGNNRIVRVQTENGLKRAGSFGSLNGAYGLAVDIYGDIYAADTGSGRILKYSPDGKLLLNFGRQGSLPGELLLPQDVTIGKSKKIYVADTGNRAVQIFSETGAYLGQLPEFAGQEVRSLDFWGGTLCLSISGKNMPEKLALGYEVKNIILDNEYFSPNGDGIKDEAIFRLELNSPAKVILEIFSKGKFVERLDLNRENSGSLRLAWRPARIRDGVYDYFLFVHDLENKKEPVFQAGKLYADLRAPEIRELFVSPDSVVDKTEPARIFFRTNERSKLEYKIYDDRFLVFESNSDEYRYASSMTWDGANKFGEMRNGHYRAEIVLTDLAGNSASPQRRNIIVNIDHPIIDRAEALPKYIQTGAREKLSLQLLRTARVKIILEEKVLLDRELTKGEHEINIDTGQLQNGIHTIHIFAETGSYQDEVFTGFVVDNIPPRLEANLSHLEIWSGGIDKTVLSFVPDEDIEAEIYLQSAHREILIPRFQQRAGEEYLYTYNGNSADDFGLSPGKYSLIIEAKDLAGNIQIQQLPFTITATGPEIKDVKLEPDILAWHAPLNRIVNIGYDLQGSSGQLYLTTRLYRNGQLIRVIADKEHRNRGKQFDQIYAEQNMPEGEYICEYILEDDLGHSFFTEKMFFYVAEKPRLFNLVQNEKAIAPINGIKNNVAFDFILQQSEYLTYYARQNPEFANLKIYCKIGDFYEREYITLPGSYQADWDGRDNQGEYVKDGVYEYEFRVADALGVFSEPVTGNIVVANSLEKINNIEILFNAPENTFNYYNGLITVNAYLKDFPLRQQIIMSLYDSADNLLETYPTQDFTVSQNYSFLITANLSDGYQLSSGQYFVKLRIIDEVGNDIDFPVETTINYTDDLEIISAAEKLSLPAVEENILSGKYEVSYVRGEPIAMNATAYDAPSSGYSNYFYIDYPQEVLLVVTDATDPKIGFGALLDSNNIRFTGEMGEEGGPYRYFLTVGRYRVISINGEDGNNSTRASARFNARDVCYKSFNENTPEVQVGLNSFDQTIMYFPQAEERARRIALVTQNTFTDNYRHIVKSENNQIYYQRILNGQTAGSIPLLISNSSALASEPAICAGEDNSVYVTWIEQIDGTYTVRAMRIPEKYLAFKNDPMMSSVLSIMSTAVAENIFVTEDLLPLAIDKQINYPNPFSDKTTIRYKLTRDAEVNIRIFTATGQPVENLYFSSGANGGRGATMARQYNDIVWDGNNSAGQSVVNGVYIYEITAQDGERTVKARGRMLKWR